MKINALKYFFISSLITFTSSCKPSGSASAPVVTPVLNTELLEIEAGQNIYTTGSASLDGYSSDAPNKVYLWEKISGPSTFTFTSASSEDTDVTGVTEGENTIGFTVTSNDNTLSDTLKIIIDQTAPTVDAGSDNLLANGPFTQNATTSDDNPVTYSWSKVVGQGTLTASSIEDPTISVSIDGNYTIQLTVQDGAGNSASDTFNMVWDSTSPSVSLSQTDIETNATVGVTATATDVHTISHLWSKTGGPGTITFSNSTGATTNITASTDGDYTIRYTATDSFSNSRSQTLNFTWDTSVPVVDTGSDITSNSLFTKVATVTDTTDTTHLWSQVSGPGTISFGSSTSKTTTITANTDGTYVVRLTATDALGNIGSDDFTLVWDSNAPTVDAGVNVSTNVQVNQDATVTDSSSITYSWTKTSGPGTITFGSAAAEDTTIAADTDGTYVIQLTATDAAGNSASDTITFFWDDTAPVVDAGIDEIVNATFAQNATASDTSALTYAWTKSSGPGNITFGTATAEDTTVTADADGSYVIQLTATDSFTQATSDTFALIWDTTAPVVNAGADLAVNTNSNIDATVTDLTTTTYAWTKVSGPGAITFGTDTAEDTTAEADTEGTYVLRLSATDSFGLNTTDDVQFIWDVTDPVVDAGVSTTTNALFTQDATTSDTNSMTYLWEKVSGPGNITFGSSNAEDTTITADADGSYVVRLTTTDVATNTANDTSTFIWDTTPPTVDAGVDVETNVVITQDATVTDATSSVTYAWTQVSGPGTITFGSAAAEDTTISANIDGAYVVRLTVTDDAGNSASDDVNFVWDTSPPVVDAGIDQITNALVTQTPTTSDLTNRTFSWVKVTGPGNITFGNATSEITTLTADTDGDYTIRLTVTDALGQSASDDMTLTWDTVNPTVSAGSIQTVNVASLQDATTADATAMTYLWTQVSGPGTITFGTDTAEDTNVSADTDGTYVLRLTATDAAGNTGSGDVNFVWDATGPTVDAGVDATQNVSYTQDATVTDTTTVTYTWSKVSGPGIIIFGSGTSEDTNVSADTDGTYVLRLTATDEAGNSTSDDFTLVWDTTIPVVNAGADVETAVQVSQDATTTDDTTMIYLWTKVSGPGNITFGSSAAEDTTISADTDGVYKVRLTVTDVLGQANSDDIFFTWDTAAPVVDAGSDSTTSAQISQDATVTDTTSLTYAWTTVSGPGTITFGSAAAEDTTISADTDGTYVIRLTATDAIGQNASDDMTLVWDGSAPVVNVGADLESNIQVSVDATTTDTTSMTYAWTKVSGPGTVTFGTSTSEDTTISVSSDGSYVIRLTATDENGNVGSDDLTLVWDTTSPVVDAGTDSTANAQISQDATVTDDTALTYAWTKVSGPGNITFGTSSAEDTTISADADGTYVIRLTATDNQGQMSSDDMTLVWDTANPVVSAGIDIITGAQVTLDGVVTDDTALTYSWTKVSGLGNITFGTSTAEDTTISSDADGTHVIRLTATDALGQSASDDMTFIWDGTAPVVNVGADLETNTQVSVDATATDSTAMTYTWTKVSGPGTVTFGTVNAEDTTISTNSDGTYVIRLTATDTNGNVGTDDLTLVWDTTAPLIDAGTDSTANAQISQDATVTDDTALTYSWTKVSGPGNITFGTNTSEDTTISADTDGTYVIRLTATDNQGQASSDDMTLVWDTTNPVVSAGVDLTTSIQVTLDGVVTDDTALTYSWTKVSGPGNITFGTSTAEDTTISSDADGTHVIRLTATDALGQSASDDMTFIWDGTAPVVNVGADLETNTQVSVDATTTDSTAMTYTWTKVSGPGAITFGSSTSEDTTISAASDGTYVIRLSATDTNGNVGTDDLTLVWDATAPTVNAGSDQTVNAQVSQDATVTDDTALTYSWTKVSGPGNITFGSAAAEDTTISADTDGSYVIRLTATDNQGQASSDDINLIWDTTNPIVNAGSDVTTSSQISQDATVTDTTSLTYAWTKVSGPGNITFGSATAEDTTISADADGTYVIRLTATDALTQNASDDITFIWDGTAPVVNVGADLEVNSQVSVDATATDSTAMTYIWSKVSGPGTITFGSGTAEDTTISASADGTYVIRLTVTDTNGNVGTDDLSLVWDATAPVVNAGSDSTANAQISQDATVTDNTALTYSWTKVLGPGNITFGSAAAEDTTISADADGTYVIRLTATDNQSQSSSDDMTLIWDTANPVVSAGSDITTGVQVTLDGVVTDDTTLTYSWTKVSGPGNITFGSVTSEDTTISSDADGTHVIRLTATDALGQSASDDLTFIWDGSAPTVSVGADQISNTQISVDATTSDSTAMTYQWVKMSGPGTITFGSANAEDSTVSASTDGVYVIQLTATDSTGNSNSDSFQLTWDATAPTVNSGSDVTTNAQVSQDATVTDLTTITYSWTKQSGAGNITFGSATSEDTTISADADGTYVIRLTATDQASNSSFDEITLVWDGSNPTVNVGADLKVNSVTGINATTTDSTTMSYAWTKVSGPGILSFGSQTSEDTSVSADTDGIYVVRLTVTDAAGNSNTDDLSLTWDTTAPVVDAGTDKNVAVQTLQDATTSDTTAMSYQWSTISGPGNISYGSATSEDTTIEADTNGAYVIRLTVTDELGQQASDDINFTWSGSMIMGNRRGLQDFVSFNAKTEKGIKNGRIHLSYSLGDLPKLAWQKVSIHRSESCLENLIYQSSSLSSSSFIDKDLFAGTKYKYSLCLYYNDNIVFKTEVNTAKASLSHIISNKCSLLKDERNFIKTIVREDNIDILGPVYNENGHLIFINSDSFFEDFTPVKDKCITQFVTPTAKITIKDDRVSSERSDESNAYLSELFMSYDNCESREQEIYSNFPLSLNELNSPFVICSEDIFGRLFKLYENKASN